MRDSSAENSNLFLLSDGVKKERYQAILTGNHTTQGRRHTLYHHPFAEDNRLSKIPIEDEVLQLIDGERGSCIPGNQEKHDTSTTEKVRMKNVERQPDSVVEVQQDSATTPMYPQRHILSMMRLTFFSIKYMGHTSSKEAHPMYANM